MIYAFLYEYVVTKESSFELKIINLQVIISSIFLELIGFDILHSENVLLIRDSQPIEIGSGCNFFKHLNTFLFFFISFPTSKKRMYKYILICLIYLSLIQIFRIMSLAICLKYFPNHWDFFHYESSYLFYYPGTLTLWYFYSSKQDVRK